MSALTITYSHVSIEYLVQHVGNNEIVSSRWSQHNPGSKICRCHTSIYQYEYKGQVGTIQCGKWLSMYSFLNQTESLNRKVRGGRIHFRNYLLHLDLGLVQYLKYIDTQVTGLGGSVGCAVRLETRRSRVQPPPRSATFFRGDWSWNIFCGHSLPSADSRRAVVSFWWKNVHNTG